MKYIITEEQSKRLKFDYLDYLFEDIYERGSDKYPTTRFWYINGKSIFELSPNGGLWVVGSIWEDISYIFGLDYNETKQLIKEWVEERIRLKDVDP